MKKKFIDVLSKGEITWWVSLIVLIVAVVVAFTGLRGRVLALEVRVEDSLERIDKSLELLLKDSKDNTERLVRVEEGLNYLKEEWDEAPYIDEVLEKMQ